MSNDLKSLIRRIKVRLRAKDPTVMADAVKLTEQYPDEPDVWDTLAFVYSIEDHYPERYMNLPLNAASVVDVGGQL